MTGDMFSRPLWRTRSETAKSLETGGVPQESSTDPLAILGTTGSRCRGDSTNALDVGESAATPQSDVGVDGGSTIVGNENVGHNHELGIARVPETGTNP